MRENLISLLPSDENSVKTRIAYKKKSLGLAKTSESHPTSWTSPGNRVVEWKAKFWGTEPYSPWWSNETRNTNAKACIFGKAHCFWSAETFHREQLSLMLIAVWFRKTYCQRSLSRIVRRSFVPNEGLVHLIHWHGWRSSRSNEWLWRRVPHELCEQLMVVTSKSMHHREAKTTTLTGTVLQHQPARDIQSSAAFSAYSCWLSWKLSTRM